MNCPSCGNENRPGAKFCRFCGLTLPADEPFEWVPQPVDSHADITVVPPPPAQHTSDDPFSTKIFGPPELSAEPPTPAASTLRTQEEDITPEIPAETTNSLPEHLPSTEINPTDAPAVVDLPSEPEAEEKPSEPVSPPALLQGATLADRYRITALLSEEPGAALYQAEDLRRCWSCGAEQTDFDPRFCEMCGMELSSHPLVMLRQTPLLPLEGPNIFQADGFTYQVEPGTEIAQPPGPPKVAGYFAGYASDTGRMREIDEDSVVILQLAGLCNRCSGPTLGFFAVADGIGGQDAGEVASRTAIHALAETVVTQVILPTIASHATPAPTSSLEDLLSAKLIQAVSTANQAIIDLRAQSATGSNMGCTLTTALLFDRLCVVANVGDSRTYRLHASQLTQITRDHSVVANMVASGEITAEQALVHDRKGVIYRCLGDLPELAIDTFLVELEIGDRLMLCCDGLWEMVPDGLIEDILLQYTDPQAACQRLVALANEAGGDDNISVIVVNIQSVT